MMDKSFWLSIRDNHFEIPVGQSVLFLTEELLSTIGSTDPELRDSIGLEAFYHWLKQGLYRADDLHGYVSRLVANLPVGMGRKEDDSVFLRSFSALWLSLIVQHNLNTRILLKDELVGISTAALTYFSGETDLRGYVPIKGYAHGIAHAADLLGALCRDPLTEANDHLNILNCIAEKMRNVTDWIFFYNEDSRIARVVLGICARNTLSTEQIGHWLADLSRNWPGAWRNEGGARAYANGRNLLRALHWQIGMQNDQPIPGKETILKLIQETIEQARPWEWVEA